MPVLALALGLDVTFIVLRNMHSTNPELDPVERLAETWADSGTSVIITSLTNVMSTLMGIITDVPAIQIFCLSTTVAVSFLFFYQITFFAAVIAFGSRREKAGRHSFFFCLKAKDVSGTSIQSKTNLLLEVFVQNPPNFADQGESEQFRQLVTELEALPECLGPESTSLWLNEYEKYLEYIGENRTTNFYASINPFFAIPESDRWTPYIQMEYNDAVDETKVKKFFFSVAYRPYDSWKERISYTTTFRSIVEKYAKKFNVTIYCDDNGNFVTDQLESIPVNTLQDELSTGFCMAVICLLFIPNFFNTLCAMVTILSINVGVFGYLVHWDVNLDPVSMTSLLLSIGYSVDFTSHISFHYYSSPGSDQREKLTIALSSIGLPMIETGFSTVLSVGCLCLVNSYLVWVYFKTTLLVVCLGLIHGLIVLPTFLSWLPMDAWDWIYSEGGQVEKNAPDATDAYCNLPHRTPNPDIVQIGLDQTAGQRVMAQA